MKKVVKLTESDLMNLIKRVIKESETSDLDSHRESCKEKFVGKTYTFKDARGLRKESITVKIDSIELNFAEKGNIFTPKANRAARAGGVIATISGSQTANGDSKDYEFKLSCQNNGNFKLTNAPTSEKMSKKVGVVKNDIYECYPLWTALVKSLVLCGEPDKGQYYCNV
jgi:hypothetical protein